MVDNKGSLATPPWNDERKVLASLFQTARHTSRHVPYRVTSNEWDLYEARMGQWAGAVLATTFRHPVDRYPAREGEREPLKRPAAPARATCIMPCLSSCVSVVQSA
jgi:hypothetical protein